MMLEEDPTKWNVATWSLILGMSFAGGAVNWLRSKKHGIVSLLCEMFISGFVGASTFMLANSFHQDVGTSASMAGISGHMSTRLIFLCENIITAKINKLDL